MPQIGNPKTPVQNLQNISLTVVKVTGTHSCLLAAISYKCKQDTLIFISAVFYRQINNYLVRAENLVRKSSILYH